MSEAMKMGDNSNDSVPNKVVDTVVNFASFLDEKRDSIATLSKADQKKLEALRPLRFSMKMDEEAKQMKMNLQYSFTTISDIEKFGEVIAAADIKELKSMNPMGDLASPSAVEGEGGNASESGGLEELYNIAESFKTSFSGSKFSRTITEEALAKSIKNKDTTMKKDDPFSDMIRFKQVYHFPYKIKSVSNPNAKILSDFKGIELEANMYEMNNDPKFFNLEVIFEQ